MQFSLHVMRPHTALSCSNWMQVKQHVVFHSIRIYIITLVDANSLGPVLSHPHVDHEVEQRSKMLGCGDTPGESEQKYLRSTACLRAFLFLGEGGEKHQPQVSLRPFRTV